MQPANYNHTLIVTVQRLLLENLHTAVVAVADIHTATAINCNPKGFVELSISSPRGSKFHHELAQVIENCDTLLFPISSIDKVIFIDAYTALMPASKSYAQTPHLV